MSWFKKAKDKLTEASSSDAAKEWAKFGKGLAEGSRDLAGKAKSSLEEIAEQREKLLEKQRRAKQEQNEKNKSYAQMRAEQVLGSNARRSAKTTARANAYRDSQDEKSEDPLEGKSPAFRAAYQQAYSAQINKAEKIREASEEVTANSSAPNEENYWDLATFPDYLSQHVVRATQQRAFKHSGIERQFEEIVLKAFNAESEQFSMLKDLTPETIKSSAKLHSFRAPDSMWLSDQDGVFILHGHRHYSDFSSTEKGALWVAVELAKYDAISQSQFFQHVNSLVFNKQLHTENVSIVGQTKKGTLNYAYDSVKSSFKEAKQNALEIIGLYENSKSYLENNFPECAANISRLIQGGNEVGTTPDSTGVVTSDFSETSLILGKSPHALVYFDSEKSLITIAPPGAGKTQCHVLPNLRTYNGPVIVLDIKGECWDETAHAREQAFGPVFKFAPSGDDTHSYNPLSFIQGDEENLWDDSRLLSEMLIVPSSSGDQTWERQGRDLLTLFIAFSIIENANASMVDVLDLANNIGTMEMFTALTESEDTAIFPTALRRTAKRFAQMQETSGKQYEGVLSGITQHLGVWESPKLERVTQESHWSPALFRQENASLYLCVATEEIERYAPVLRVIIGQHVRRLMAHDSKHERGKPPILFMLDEMPRLGNMAPIREALEAGRSYGLKLWMICQHTGQLTQSYGKEIAEGMIGSCGAQIYMNPNAKDAETISKRLGTHDNLLDGTKKPVATPQELEGPEFKDHMIVFSQGEKPLKLKKVFDHSMNL